MGCSKAEPTENASARPVQKVAVASAVQEEVTDYVELVGRLAADEKVVIQSRVSGFLLKTHFTDGQRVQAGDLLFTIEPDEYQAIYEQAQAQISVAETQLELARKKFARSQKLLDNDAISREEFDEDQAAVAEAAANVIAKQADSARVKLDVDYTKITSPISGRVDRALLDDGNFVTGGLTGGTVLTTVLKDRPIKAIANINEGVRLTFMRRQRELGGKDFKEADKIQELKIPCFLQLQDETDFPHEGTLEYAESQVNEQTGTSQIRAVFENANGLLTTGMFVRLKVPVSDAHPAVLVPDTAIGTDQATKFVYVVNDQNEVQHRTVEVGDRQGKRRVILSGVKPNESVVVAGMQLIQPGMKVEPVSETP
jgi:RND family efflux transporter MFP subunit